MKRTVLTSAIGCFSWLYCLGCVTGESLEDDAKVLNGEENGLATSVGLYQAEKFTAKSGCSIATNKAGYTGTGFVDYGGNGTWIELNNVNVAQAGNYTLKFRYATAAGSRQCAILINGTNVGNVAFSSTGSWTTWRTASITKSLKAGNNTIRVLANTSSGGPNLDSMEVLSNISGTSSCSEAAENKTLALSCPAGQVVAVINFASYGLPTGSCPSGFATGACHAVSSLDKVKASCLNKQSCSVAASNNVFGDPCQGKAKKLAVVYTCGGIADACPNDPNKTSPGVCGCGVADTDTDKDGTVDCKDGCKTDPKKTAPGKCGCNKPEGSCGGLTFPLRGAFYYSWFPQTWSVNGAHVFYHPTLGYYSSDDIAAVDQHIKGMDYAKIDVAIASWWGSDDQKQATRIPLLLNRTIALGSPLKWAFYYEDEGFGDPSVNKLKADLNYLMTTYAGHQAIARVNGKPVVFVYGGGCEEATRWSQASQGKWYVNLKLTSGFKNCPTQPDGWHQYGPNAAAQRHAGYSYVIAPGFWRADQKTPLLARDIGRWYKNVADMVASREPWQLITTFNEWGEGTAVESATEWKSASGFGQYLDALHSDGVK